MTAEPNGLVGPTNLAMLPNDAEVRAMLDEARRLRAETLARLARVVLARIGGRPAGAGTAAAASAQVGGMPHARA